MTWHVFPRFRGRRFSSGFPRQKHDHSRPHEYPRRFQFLLVLQRAPFRPRESLFTWNVVHGERRRAAVNDIVIIRRERCSNITDFPIFSARTVSLCRDRCQQSSSLRMLVHFVCSSDQFHHRLYILSDVVSDRW